MQTQPMTESRFLSDVANHEINIVLNSGINRVVTFRNPSDSNMWFGLTTWHGCLCFYGDMGTFVFQRTQDMFTFFRSRTDALNPNPQYWAEKLNATDWRSGHVEFSKERFRDAVEECVNQFMDTAENDGDFDTDAEMRQYERELREAIESDVMFVLAEFNSCDRALQSAMEFEFEKYDVRFEFTDFNENNFDQYTIRFMWACYAIQWGIHRFDAATQSLETVQ